LYPLRAVDKRGSRHGPATKRRLGARLGLFSLAKPDARATGHADFDWIRVTRPGVE